MHRRGFAPLIIVVIVAAAAVIGVRRLVISRRTKMLRR